MSPTIKAGDKIVIDRHFYKRGSQIQRFDIVAFEVSDIQAKEMGRTKGFLSAQYYVKRIVGLPNEKLEIKTGQVYINDELLDEPFEKRLWPEDNFGPQVIPPNEYFVLGDDRPNSFDSRYLKPATVSKEDILGKVMEIMSATK